MKPSVFPRIKICCIASVEEAQLAIRYGASALGLVSEMPSGPGVIDEAQIREIADTIPPGVASFLLTLRQDVASIIEQQRRCNVNTIQICDRLEEGTYEELRLALPGIAIVQVIHVTGQESVLEAQAIAPHVQALLLDSGNQSLAIKELGGTGRVHDWTLSAQIREFVPVPIFLAGGINASNLGDALRQVGPYGIDLCSSVRTDGHLDEKKLARLFAALRSRAELLSGHP